MTASDLIPVVVADRRRVARGVEQFELVSATRDRLPEWDPGAHIDVILDTGATRQYSLCGNPDDRSTYRIAVLREAHGRGGSRQLHDATHTGDALMIRAPRNHFPFDRSAHYIFIAGGIGITPLVPMLHTATLSGADWTLFYCGRSRETMAFLPELEKFGGRVTISPSKEGPRLDLRSIICNAHPQSLIYCCGPEGLIKAVSEEAESFGIDRSLRTELFKPSPDARSDRTSFIVELARTGTRHEVRADQNLIDVLLDAGADILTSCEEGTCGTCETRVLAGEPDHRDVVLSDDTRATNTSMMVCVSRSKSVRLVLDL